MIVVLGPGPDGPVLGLERAGELDRFHLEVRAPGADLDAALRAAGLGGVEGERAGIEVAGLRELAGPARDPEWEAGLEGMVAFAASRGWTRGSALRAHVERP